MLGQHCRQGFPYRIARRVAHQHAVFDEPAFLATPEGPDRGLDTILLHVRAADQQQATAWHAADTVVLAALDQPLPVGCFAFLDPGLAQFRVLEGFDGSS